MGKRLFAILAASALLLLPYSDCVSAMAQDHEAMKCCSSMPCAPAHHGNNCCKAILPDLPKALPAARLSLHAPPIVTSDYSETFKLPASRPVLLLTVAAPQESPPELYTLHASLLI
jgi:hypothetical protein